VLWRRNRLDEAVAELRRAADLLPGDAAAHYNFGRVLRKTGQLQEAAVELNKARELNDKAQDAILAKTYNNTATKLLQQGRFGDAVAKLQEALLLDPESAAVHYNYGVALLETNQVEKAITELKAALSLNADQPDAYYYLGRASWAKGQPNSAAENLAQALKLNPGDARAHNARAVALAAMQQFPEAAKELQSALGIDSGNQLFRQNLACLERRLQGCTLKP
jgi:protein O-GlcNAc transferase